MIVPFLLCALFSLPGISSTGLCTDGYDDWSIHPSLDKKFENAVNITTTQYVQAVKDLGANGEIWLHNGQKVNPPQYDAANLMRSVAKLSPYLCSTDSFDTQVAMGLLHNVQSNPSLTLAGRAKLLCEVLALHVDMHTLKCFDSEFEFDTDIPFPKSMSITYPAQRTTPDINWTNISTKLPEHKDFLTALHHILPEKIFACIAIQSMHILYYKEWHPDPIYTLCTLFRPHNALALNNMHTFASSSPSDT